MPKLQFGHDYYRLVGDGGEEGDPVEYGEAAILKVGSNRYMAIVDMEEGDEVVSLLPDEAWIENNGAKVKVNEETDLEEVDFKFEGGPVVEEEDEEEDDDDLDGEDDEDEGEDGDEEEEEVEIDAE